VLTFNLAFTFAYANHHLPWRRSASPFFELKTPTYY
jgi:hypothetical protein